jgi:hypothetical protein
MADKYLLYIDVLGFGNLVHSNPAKVNQLYRIIDSLNVHSHHAFHTVVFSDTVVVYNAVQPRTLDDNRYLVMYACEFAQDLQYRLVGQDIFFRAVLVRGQFEHYNLEHIQCFYGSALIDAYSREKKIPAIGLFIDDACNIHNAIFPTHRFDSGASFVYLNQSLERLQRNTEGTLPTDPIWLETTDEYWDILSDIRFLHDIYDRMHNHSNLDVRAKYLNTWNLFRQRYPAILSEFAAASFAPAAVCKNFEWGPKIRQLEDDLPRLFQPVITEDFKVSANSFGVR